MKEGIDTTGPPLNEPPVFDKWSDMAGQTVMFPNILLIGPHQQAAFLHTLSTTNHKCMEGHYE